MLRRNDGRWSSLAHQIGTLVFSVTFEKMAIGKRFELCLPCVQARRWAPQQQVGGNVSGGVFDILIVGGGINGCGIARDAVGRGLVGLSCEKGDLAGATSSAGQQADPRRPALSRILRVPAGARGAAGARDAVGASRRTSSGHAFRPAAPKGAAAGLAAAARPVPLRSPWRARKTLAGCERIEPAEIPPARR